MHSFWLAFASLTSKEGKVISLRVRPGRTWQEVAGEVGITMARAQAIEATALEKFRQRFDAGGIPLRELLPGGAPRAYADPRPLAHAVTVVHGPERHWLAG
jgi:hypothetical protein